MIVDLQKKTNDLTKKKSDINEHIPTLVEYASGCNHIVEMGVRWVVSTWAFLAAHPKKVTSYDLFHPSRYGGDLQDVYDTAKKNNIDFSFVEASVLDIEIEGCDLLFIDTWHCYNQLIRELRMHSPKVKKYIILHDTTTFGHHDEQNHRAQSFRDAIIDKKGLQPAVNDFLMETTDWKVRKIYTNNNGLTILERKNESL
jgi:hypothetical protein